MSEASRLLRVDPYPSAPNGKPPSPVAASRDSYEDALIHCQRLAALGSISSMIAHEINNIMTPVIARAQFALTSGRPDDMRIALDRILRQSQRAVDISKRLLSYSQPSEAAQRRVRMIDAVNEAIETIVRPPAKDGIDLIVDVEEDLHVVADGDLLTQLLVNLLLNARQAMDGVRGPLRIRAVREDDTIVLSVCDSGCGLPPERIDKVINPFLGSAKAGDDDWQRVGLGLYICRTIAQRHGATLQARRNDSRGCTFELRWPAA